MEQGTPPSEVQVLPPPLPPPRSAVPSPHAPLPGVRPSSEYPLHPLTPATAHLEGAAAPAPWPARTPALPRPPCQSPLLRMQARLGTAVGGARRRGQQALGGAGAGARRLHSTRGGAEVLAAGGTWCCLLLVPACSAAVVSKPKYAVAVASWVHAVRTHLAQTRALLPLGCQRILLLLHSQSCPPLATCGMQTVIRFARYGGSDQTWQGVDEWQACWGLDVLNIGSHPLTISWTCVHACTLTHGRLGMHPPLALTRKQYWWLHVGEHGGHVAPPQYVCSEGEGG